jgi:CHRD domain
MRSGTWKAPLSRTAFVVIAAIGFAAGGIAMAGESVLMLTGEQEVPPVKTAASARSAIVVGNDMVVSGSVETTGIEGTMAHIHQGAVGKNGPVIVTLTRSSPTRWSAPAGTTLTKAQYESFKAGDLYVNVHSTAYKDGEIRAQLQP